MVRSRRLLIGIAAHVILAGGVVALGAGPRLPSPGRVSSAAPAQPAERTTERLAQRGDPDSAPRGRSFWGRWWRGTSNNQKDHSDVKRAYQRSAERAANATASVLLDEKVVALATVVDADGYLVTKASLLADRGKLACRFFGGESIEVTRVGADEDYDLALLKLNSPVPDVTPVPWRADPAAAGTLVAAVNPDGEVLGVGVISTEPRRIRGTSQVVRRRAWLGVSLGGGEAETGVTAVVQNSPAQQAGLRGGDQIRGIDGTEMKSMEQIVATIGGHAPGDTVALLVARDAEILQLSATLSKPPEGLDPQDHWGGGPFSERRAGFPEVLTHDTIIRPEQCGGPLVDTEGNAVGVNIARALRVTTYAVPAATVQRVVSELKRN